MGTAIITDWSVKRSGAAMSIAGKIDGAPVKLTGIYTISPGLNGAIVATADNGEEYELANGFARVGLRTDGGAVFNAGLAADTILYAKAGGGAAS